MPNLAISAPRLFALSIDVPFLRDATGNVVRAADQLLKAVLFHRLPATWAVPDPGASPFALHVATEWQGHEIALLTDAAWASDTGRAEFLRQLQQRTEQAHRTGITVSTLASYGRPEVPHVDLLTRHHINAVRGATLERSGGVAKLRHGLWKVGVSGELRPAKSAWAFGGDAGAIRRSLYDAANPEPVVVRVDAGQIGLREIDSLNRILSLVRDLENRQIVEVGTIARVVASKSPPLRRTTGQSILRAA